MNKTDLINKTAEITGTSKKDAGTVINTVIDIISTELKEGREVSISKFGTFKSVHKDESVARNPKTGEKVVVPAKNVPKFTFAENIKESLKQSTTPTKG